MSTRIARVPTERWMWALTSVALAAACAGESGSRDQVEVGEHAVVIRMTDDLRFDPENPAITVGDTVVWIIEGALPHTSTDKPGTAGVDEHTILPEGAEPWDSGLLDPGETYRTVLTVTGDYTYVCLLHEAAGMVGRLTVQ